MGALEATSADSLDRPIRDVEAGCDELAGVCYPLWHWRGSFPGFDGLLDPLPPRLMRRLGIFSSVFVLGLKPGDLCLAVALDLGQGALDCIDPGGLAGT